MATSRAGSRGRKAGQGDKSDRGRPRHFSCRQGEWSALRKASKEVTSTCTVAAVLLDAAGEQMSISIRVSLAFSSLSPSHSIQSALHLGAKNNQLFHFLADRTSALSRTLRSIVVFRSYTPFNSSSALTFRWRDRLSEQRPPALQK